MAHNEKPHLLGNPYVLWNSRPAKNGQPPPCIGQCNINIGTRKVGAAMKRLPQIFMGPKSKDQILQKWDPVSRTLVNLHCACISPPTLINNVVLTISYPVYSSPNYYSDYTISFETKFIPINEPIQYSVFNITNPATPIFTQTIYSSDQSGFSYSGIGISGESYYAVLTYNGNKFKSPIIKISLINITNFSASNNGTGFYDITLQWRSTLNAIPGNAAILYNSLNDGYNNASQYGDDHIIDIQDSPFIFHDVQPLTAYYFAEVTFNNEIFRSVRIPLQAPSISINSFSIDTTTPSASIFTVNFSGNLFSSGYSQFTYEVYDNGTSPAPPYGGGTRIGQVTNLQAGSSIITYSVIEGRYYYPRVFGGSVDTFSPAILYSNTLPIPYGLNITYTDAVGSMTYTFQYDTTRVAAGVSLTYMLFSATNSSGAGLTPMLGSSPGVPSNGTGSRSGTATFISGHSWYIVKIYNGASILATSAFNQFIPPIYISAITIGEGLPQDGVYQSIINVSYDVIAVALPFTLYGTNSNTLDTEYATAISTSYFDSDPATNISISFLSNVYSAYFINVLGNIDIYSTHLFTRIVHITSPLVVTLNQSTYNSLLYTIGYTSSSGTQVDFTVYGFDGLNGDSPYDDSNNTICSTQTSNATSGTFSGSFPYNSSLYSFYARFVVNGVTYYSNYTNSFISQDAIQAFGTYAIVSPYLPYSCRLLAEGNFGEDRINTINNFSISADFTLTFKIPSRPAAASSISIRLTESVGDNYAGVVLYLTADFTKISINVSGNDGQIYLSPDNYNAFDSNTQFTIKRTATNVFIFQKDNINIISPYIFPTQFNTFIPTITPGTTNLAASWTIDIISITGSAV